MRICVVGAGAIGGLIAVRLAATEHEVSVIARGAHLNVIQNQGLKLVEADGTVTSTRDLKSSDDFSSPGVQDIVILAIKAHQIATVSAELTALWGPKTMIVPVQNGIPWWYFEHHGGPHDGHRLQSLDPTGVISSRVPADQIVASIAFPAATKTAPGIITHVDGDRLPVGELDGSRSERAFSLTEIFSGAGFKSRLLTDIRSHIWLKAWGNLAFNPISALTGATLGEICRLPETRGLATALMAEALEVATALDVRVRLTIEQRIVGAESVGDHKTSMLQDAEAGRQMEIDSLVGVFVELGELVGVPTPLISAIYSMVLLLDSRVPTATEGARA